MMNKKRYAIIGISGRSKVFTGNILKYYSDTCEIVALVDRNPIRMQEFNNENSLNIPCFKDDEFSKMLKETSPDAVIIATNDATHHTYVIKALQNNIDAITEKPMTIDEEKVKEIIAAEKQSKAKVTVTFNFRFAPVMSRIKELIEEGKLGRVTDINFSHCLDTFHGWSYFKRWNRYIKESGGLLVTKSCHHFDIVNWWLGQKPREIYAVGGLNYYGPDAENNPSKTDKRRCSTCQEKCRYYKRHSLPGGAAEPYNRQLFSLNNANKNEIFATGDGYFADMCSFDSDIDMLDTYSAVIKYDKGAILNYTLNASTPYQSTKITINGTGGRLEVDLIDGADRPGRLPFEDKSENIIKYYPLFDGMQVISVISKGGGHGGADPLLAEQLFASGLKSSLLNSMGAEAGAYSVLIGVACTDSIKKGKPVLLDGFDIV